MVTEIEHSENLMAGVGYLLYAIVEFTGMILNFNATLYFIRDLEEVYEIAMEIDNMLKIINKKYCYKTVRILNTIYIFEFSFIVLHGLTFMVSMVTKSENKYSEVISSILYFYGSLIEAYTSWKFYSLNLLTRKIFLHGMINSIPN